MTVSQNCILRRHPATPSPVATARNRPVFPEACGLIAVDETPAGFVGPEQCRSQGRPPMRPTAGLGDEIPSGFGIAGLLKQQSRMRDPGNRKNVPVAAFPHRSSSCSGTLNLQSFFASRLLGVRFCISVRLCGGLGARNFPPCAARNIGRWKTKSGVLPKRRYEQDPHPSTPRFWLFLTTC